MTPLFLTGVSGTFSIKDKVKFGLVFFPMCVSGRCLEKLPVASYFGYNNRFLKISTIFVWYAICGRDL